jgi:hypothetical protein
MQLQWLLVFCIHATLSEAVVWFNSSASLPSTTTSACLHVLFNDIACNATLKSLRPRLYLPESVLRGLCTSACGTALATYEANIVSSCKGQTYDSLSSDGFVPVSVIPQLLRYTYNYTCLTDKSTGQYCNVLSASAAGILPDQSNLGRQIPHGEGKALMIS